MRLFKLNETVRLLSPNMPVAQASPDGVYEVIRLLPQDQAGDFCYRLKSSAGERVAREVDLVPMHEAL